MPAISSFVSRRLLLRLDRTGFVPGLPMIGAFTGTALSEPTPCLLRMIEFLRRMICFASSIVCMIQSSPIIRAIVFSASSRSSMAMLASLSPVRNDCNPKSSFCSLASSRIKSLRIATYLGQYSMACISSSTPVPHCLHTRSFLSSRRLLPVTSSRFRSFRPVSTLRSFVPLLSRKSIILPTYIARIWTAWCYRTVIATATWMTVMCQG